jgi:hypothetical protein
MPSANRLSKEVQKDATKILRTYGRTISRRRADYVDADGIEIVTPDLTLKALIEPLRVNSDQTMFNDMGLENVQTGDPHTIIFQFDKDIRDGDILSFSGRQWRVLRVVPRPVVELDVMQIALCVRMDEV